MTAVLVASCSTQTQSQPHRATPSPASPIAHFNPFVSTPAAIDGTSRDAAPRALSPPAASVAAAATSGLDHRPSPSSESPAKATYQAPAPAASMVREGSRVRIEGLQAAREMNGRTGVVCAALDESGRWTVQIDADGARAACRGTFRAANLRVIPSHNFGTEWVDEEGRVWRKNVDFSRECAKGHALALVGDCGGDGGGMQLMCRLCHSFCARGSDEAASWLTCSVVVGCCGGGLLLVVDAWDNPTALRRAW